MLAVCTQTMVPKRPFQGHDERSTIIVFCQKVAFIVLYLHVSDALASTIKVGGLVGHFLVKSDDILHHGFEVAFHDEFAERERAGATPPEFHPEGVFVFHNFSCFFRLQKYGSTIFQKGI